MKTLRCQKLEAHRQSCCFHDSHMATIKSRSALAEVHQQSICSVLSILLLQLIPPNSTLKTFLNQKAADMFPTSILFGCGFSLRQLLLEALNGLQALLQLSLVLGCLRFSFPLHIFGVFQLPVTPSFGLACCLSGQEW